MHFCSITIRCYVLYWIKWRRWPLLKLCDVTRRMQAAERGIKNNTGKPLVYVKIPTTSLRKLVKNATLGFMLQVRAGCLGGRI